MGGMGTSGVPVVREWQNNTAPTGEGTMIDLSNGETWQRITLTHPADTGDRRGVLLDGKIYERD